MPRYNHDMMHCSQERCTKKEQCYRYWLGQHMVESGFQYGSFYNPSPDFDLTDCSAFLDIKRW